MENEIKRGDYVILKPYVDRSKNPIFNKLYDDNYGRNGLVRNVTYAPSQPWKVAEVIFSGVPYISIVPIIYLDFIRKREEWPLRTKCFPEPDMTVVNYPTAGIAKKVRSVFFNIRDCEFEEQCYFEDGKVDILNSDASIKYGNPEIKKYYYYEKYEKEKIMENSYDCGYASQYIYQNYIDTDISLAHALADLRCSSQNLSKGESTMKNTNKKSTPSNPIKQVIFNGPATIVYWKDGCKTVVKCQEDAVNDHEKGLAMAVARHYFCDILGMSRYDGIFKKYLPKETKEK